MTFTEWTRYARETGVLQVVNPTARDVYWLLRSFVWRRYDKGHPKVLEWSYAGLVVSDVTQLQIGDCLGLAERTIQMSMRTLREVGWVCPKRMLGRWAYVLGYWHKSAQYRDGDGFGSSVFWADEYVEMAYGSLVKSADEHNTQARQMAWEQRHAVLAAFREQHDGEWNPNELQ